MPTTTPINFANLSNKYFKPLVHRDFATVGTIIYAKQGGSSSADGLTELNAVHLQRAMELVPTGGTVVLISPVFRVTAPIYIRRQCYIQNKAGIGKVKIKGSRQLPSTVWTTTPTAGVFKTPWTVAFNNPYLNDSYTTPETAYLQNVQGVFINDEPLQQKGSIQSLDANSFHHDKVNGQLYIKRDPATAGNIEAAAVEQILINTAGVNAVVRNVILTQAKIGAFSAVPMKWEDCQFDKNALSGYHGLSHPGVTEVFQCTFNNNGFKGYEGRRCVVSKSELAFNNFKGYRIAWDAAGAKVITTPTTTAYDPLISKTEFSGNYVHNNYSNGIWYDMHITGGVPRWNVVTDNQGIGIFYEVSMGGRITGNIALNNGVDIQVSNSKDTFVYNNTVSPKANAIVFKTTNRLSDKLTETEKTYLNGWINYVSTGNRCFNNLVVNTPQGNKIAFSYLPASFVTSLTSMMVETGNNYVVNYTNVPDGILYRAKNPNTGYEDYLDANSFRADFPTMEANSYRKPLGATENIFIPDTFDLTQASNMRGIGRQLNTELAGILGANANSGISPGAIPHLSSTDPASTTQPTLTCEDKLIAMTQERDKALGLLKESQDELALAGTELERLQGMISNAKTALGVPTSAPDLAGVE
jgi:parallel beta-helix repeat protein